MREQSASRVKEATVRIALAASQAVRRYFCQQSKQLDDGRGEEAYPFELIEREISCSVDP